MDNKSGLSGDTTEAGVMKEKEKTEQQPSEEEGMREKWEAEDKMEALKEALAVARDKKIMDERVKQAFEVLTQALESDIAGLETTKVVRGLEIFVGNHGGYQDEAGEAIKEIYDGPVQPATKNACQEVLEKWGVIKKE